MKSYKNLSPLQLIAGLWVGAVTLFFIDFYGAYAKAPNKLLIVVFMGLHVGLLLVIDRIPMQRTVPILTSEKRAKVYFFCALAASIMLLPLNIHYYTGSKLSELSIMFFDPVRAYQGMHDALIAERTERLGFLILKLTLSWLTVCLVPLAIILRKRGVVSTKILLLSLGITFVLSIFRGTDKEVGDILIFIFAALFLKFPYSASQSERGIKKNPLIMNAKRIIAVGLPVLVFLSMFGFRKGERLSEVVVFCFQNSTACLTLPSNNNGPLTFGIMMLYGYLTHGFYGLGVSFDADQNICPFLGHSSVLRYILSFSGLVCDITIHDQVEYLGWAARGSWSTGFVQLAGDFGHIGTYMQIATFAIALKVFHRTYQDTGCFISGVLFSLNFFILFYMIGNLQIQQNGEQYFGYIFLNIFALVALILKGRRSH